MIDQRTRLAEVAFRADVEHMAEAQGSEPEHYIGWSYYVAVKAPIVQRYESIARAVAEAMLSEIHAAVSEEWRKWANIYANEGEDACSGVMAAIDERMRGWVGDVAPNEVSTHPY